MSIITNLGVLQLFQGIKMSHTADTDEYGYYGGAYSPTGVPTNFINIDSLVKNNQAYLLKTYNISDSVQSSDYIGDFNGDGLDDFVLSAPLISGNLYQYSISYVIYGNKKNLIDLENLTPAAGLAIVSEPYNYTVNEDNDDYDEEGTILKNGHIASTAGDFNNDGYKDVLISIPYYYDNKGLLYVVYGGKYNTSNLYLENITSDQGFAIYGSKYMNSGTYSQTIGDFNGDGFSDIGIYEEQDPTITILYGNNNSKEIYLNTLNHSQGFKIFASDSSLTEYGESVTGFGYGRTFDNIGDINEDGYADMAIAESNYIEDLSKIFIIYGSNRTNDIELSKFNNSIGYKYALSATETTVRGLGDINGDDIPDILIGSHNEGEDYQGKLYVIFGNKTNFEGFDIKNINNRGFIINGKGFFDQIGEVIASGLDVNNDGFNDILFGSSNEEDGAYMVFGGTNVSDVDLRLNSDRFINIGVTFDADVPSVSRVGDFNNDGYEDFVISYKYRDTNMQRVLSHYLVFDLYNTSRLSIKYSLPTTIPSAKPIIILSSEPTLLPSLMPSDSPTSNPSIRPSNTPSVFPTVSPSITPSDVPTIAPSTKPSLFPSFKPSFKPTLKPTLKPSFKPTLKPSLKPTSATPTQKPSLHTTTLSPTFDRDNLPPYVINLSKRDLSNVESNDLVCSTIEIGDFSNDGLKDYFVYGQTGNNAGPVVTVGKIFFSKSTSFLDNFCNDINSENLIKFTYSSISNFYPAVSGIGDYNLDGSSDIAFCVYSIQTCYIIYGTSLLEDIYLPDLDTSKGFKITDTSQTYTAGYFSLFGASVAGGFDFDGDGKSDFAITDYSYNNFQGRVYVILGKANLRSGIDLNLSLGQKGIIIFSGFIYNYVYKGYSLSSRVQAGHTVISLGDYNGDGFDDVGISSSASIFVVYGSSDTNGFSLDAIPFNRGFTYTGDYGDTMLPSPTVRSIGDFNGDGLQDLAICYGIYHSEGSSVVNTGATTKIILGNYLNDNNPTFEIPNACSGLPGSEIGSATKVYDVNGDGYDDFFISKTTLLPIAGSQYFFPSGYYHLIFGKSSGFSNINFENFNSNQGIVFLDDNTYDVIDYGTSFKSLSNAVSAGDLNKDGYADFLLSSVSQIYLIYGRSNFVKNELIPSFQPTSVTSDIPTALPTMKPTFMPTEAIVVTDGGTYNGTSISENFIIDASTDITISGGGGIDMYTLKPHAGVIITITDFNKTSDIINLNAFNYIHNFNALNITAGSIIITLENNQKMRLLELSPGDIDANNFIFAPSSSFTPTSSPTSNDDGDRPNDGIFSTGVITGIAVGGAVLLGIGGYALYAYFNNYCPFSLFTSIPTQDGVDTVIKGTNNVEEGIEKQLETGAANTYELVQQQGLEFVGTGMEEVL